MEGYESYEKMCGYVAEIFFSVTEQKLRQQLTANSTESINITAYTLYKVGEAKCPAYWASNELLTALMQSEISVEIDNLNWAVKTGFFMLPKGVILSPEKRSIDTIFWHYDPSEKFLYWTASDGSSFFCRRFLVADNSGKFTYADVQDIDAQLVKDFNEYLQSIFLRLILVMECRPELVDSEEQQQKITVNKGFGKDSAKDFYEPLWVGRTYRIKRERTYEGESQGGTKNPHLRKGFVRSQPYGEGRKERKVIWIEPVMVMGGE
ncbi:hypothetical protein [Scytonema sp. UIC 10036]|uniref:hypothetical protein n=1 Tax=Scytonema sp. UIC 10036 TaxID=2304196 RepID=UPI00325BD8BE